MGNARPDQGAMSLQLLIVPFVVIAFVAIVWRFLPRAEDGSIRLPRLIDESVGMWVIRSALGRATDSADPDDIIPEPAEDEIAYRIGVPGAPPPTVPTPVVIAAGRRVGWTPQDSPDWGARGPATMGGSRCPRRRGGRRDDVDPGVAPARWRSALGDRHASRIERSGLRERRGRRCADADGGAKRHAVTVGIGGDLWPFTSPFRGGGCEMAAAILPPLCQVAHDRAQQGRGISRP